MRRQHKKNNTLHVCFALVVTGILFIPVQSGFLLTDGNGKPFYFIRDDTKQIIVGWRHSVELTPWKETYLVMDNGKFSLESTTYKSYGAGTPQSEGTTELLSDGTIQVTGVERILPYYSLFYIPISQYYVEVNGENYQLSDFVPDYQIVQIHYGSLLMYELINLTYLHN